MARKRKGKRRPPGRWKSWKKYMAHIRKAKKGGKSMAKRRGRRHSSAKRRPAARRHTRRRRSSSRRIAVVRHPVLVNPRRRRYHRRHNPRFSVGGIIGRIKSGAVDGVWVVGGKAVTNVIPSLIGLAPTGALGLAVKALSAVVAGMLFGMISPNAGKLATASGFASLYEPFLTGLPLIGPALAGEDELGYGSYPEAVPGVGSYPEAIGDDDGAAYGAMY